MTVLYPYQRQGVRGIEVFEGRALLADEMGLGKSIQALEWWHVNQERASPVLVVCPASLKWNWAHELSIHFNKTAHVVEGRTHVGFNSLHVPQIVIINYEILHNHLKWILQKLRPQFVILDECQNIKNPKSQRSKTVQKLCHIKNVPYVVALSGTPLTNRPAELWPVLNVLRGDLYPSFRKYAMRYCAPKLRRWGWDFSGATRIKELHQHLKENLMIRRLKKDVLTQLPKTSRHVIPLPIEDAKQYEEARVDFLTWLRNSKGSKKLQKNKHALAMAQVGYLKRLAAKLKWKYVREWVKQWLEEHPREKLVFFCIHKPAVRAMQKEFPGAVVIVGSTSSKMRQQAVRKFQEHNGTRLLIANIQSGGVGLNLTKSSTVVFGELSWIPTEHAQGEKRVDRIGQTMPCEFYYLVASGTIEERLCSLLTKKNQVCGEILDGVADRSFNLQEQLLRALENDK